MVVTRPSKSRYYVALSSRRSTIGRVRTTALDGPANVPKSLELECRVARVEQLLAHINESLETLMKRSVAMQAYLDHISARINRS